MRGRRGGGSGGELRRGEKRKEKEKEEHRISLAQ
jgi:hypothetical protein